MEERDTVSTEGSFWPMLNNYKYGWGLIKRPLLDQTVERQAVFHPLNLTNFLHSDQVTAVLMSSLYTQHSLNAWRVT